MTPERLATTWPDPALDWVSECLGEAACRVALVTGWAGAT